MNHGHQEAQSGIFTVLCNYCFVFLGCLITVLTWVQPAKGHSAKHTEPISPRIKLNLSLAMWLRRTNTPSLCFPTCEIVCRIWSTLSEKTYEIFEIIVLLLLRWSCIFTPSFSSLLIADSRQYGKVQVISKVMLKLCFESQWGSSAALRCHLM